MTSPPWGAEGGTLEWMAVFHSTSFPALYLPSPALCTKPGSLEDTAFLPDPSFQLSSPWPLKTRTFGRRDLRGYSPGSVSQNQVYAANSSWTFWPIFDKEMDASFLKGNFNCVPAFCRLSPVLASLPWSPLWHPGPPMDETVSPLLSSRQWSSSV